MLIWHSIWQKVRAAIDTNSFTEELHELSVSKKQISDDLLRGIEQGELVAYSINHSLMPET